MELFGQIGNGSEDPAADPIALDLGGREVETHFRVLWPTDCRARYGFPLPTKPWKQVSERGLTAGRTGVLKK